MREYASFILAERICENLAEKTGGFKSALCEW